MVGVVHPLAGAGSQRVTPRYFNAIGRNKRKQDRLLQRALPIQVGGEKLPSGKYVDLLQGVVGDKIDYFTELFFFAAPSSLQ